MIDQQAVKRCSDAIDTAKQILIDQRVQQFSSDAVVALAGLLLEQESSQRLEELYSTLNGGSK